MRARARARVWCVSGVWACAACPLFRCAACPLVNFLFFLSLRPVTSWGGQKHAHTAFELWLLTGGHFLDFLFVFQSKRGSLSHSSVLLPLSCCSVRQGNSHAMLDVISGAMRRNLNTSAINNLIVGLLKTSGISVSFLTVTAAAAAAAPTRTLVRGLPGSGASVREARAAE